MFIIKDIDDIGIIESFLNDLGLKLPQKIDYTVGIYDGEKIIGTGSVSGNILKGIGINSEYQNEGIMGKIITHLMNKSISLGHDELYVYTKPHLAFNFQSYGFKKVAEASPYVTLLEWTHKGIEYFVNKLKQRSFQHVKQASCIVMNANPFTLGHLKLIEKAAKESPWLYVIVVEEDCSLFPYSIRHQLIVEGTKHIKNLSVLPGGQYVISSLTFPSYFTRKEDLAIAHAHLDLEIFCQHIAPSLDVKKRYVGVEPYCEVTSYYNEAMKKILPEYNVSVEEVERFKINGEIVSASKVREYIKLDRLQETKSYLPETTYRFLSSKACEDIIENIKKSNSRH